jgi:hypothetical protein
MKAIQQVITTSNSSLLGLLQHLKQVEEMQKNFSDHASVAAE